jgi:hypothetical protein
LSATQTEKGKKVVYGSSVDLTIPRVKPQEQVLPNGKTVVTNKADYEQGLVRFDRGFLETREGEDLKPNPDTGEPEDLVTFLERQESFNDLFHRIEDPAPPVSSEEMSRIMELVAANDRQGLAEVYQAEVDGHQRPEVLGPIEKLVKDG